MSTTKPNWRLSWQRGFCPQLPTQGLQALQRALEQDSPALWQQELADPPELPGSKARVRGACAIGYCAWKGFGLTTVDEVIDHFCELCRKAEEIGGPGTGDAFIGWFDHAPRKTMLRLLLEEVDRELARRGEVNKPTSHVRLKRIAGKSARQLVAC